MSLTEDTPGRDELTLQPHGTPYREELGREWLSGDVDEQLSPAHMMAIVDSAS